MAAVLGSLVLDGDGGGIAIKVSVICRDHRVFEPCLGEPAQGRARLSITVSITPSTSDVSSDQKSLTT